MSENKLNEILEKSAQYVEESQLEIGNLKAEIQKQASERLTEKKAFDLQAQRTAAVLADRGVIEASKVNDFVDKLASNPVETLKTLEKVSKLIGNSSLGGPSAVKEASAPLDVCPFVAELMPELVNNTRSGLVD
jgi:hypothetical protein